MKTRAEVLKEFAGATEDETILNVLTFGDDDDLIAIGCKIDVYEGETLVATLG